MLAALHYAREIAPVGEYACTSYKPDNYGRPLVDLHLKAGHVLRCHDRSRSRRHLPPLMGEDRRSTRRRRKLTAARKSSWKRQQLPCVRCGQPIDYELPWDDKQAVTEEHIRPWSTHPHLRDDPTNLGPAHADCNKSRGNRNPAPSLGMTGQEW